MRSVFLTVIFVLLSGQMVRSQETAQSEPSKLSVEADVCVGITERMPVGVGTEFPADVDRLYLWCRVTGAADSTGINHVWLHQGREMASVKLPVKSPAWRTWSSKAILPDWTGDWQVHITNDQGDTLKTLSFVIMSTVTADTTRVSRPVDTTDVSQPEDTTTVSQPEDTGGTP